VVIYNFYVAGVSFLPAETYSELVINSNAVLAFAISLQGFQPVPWRYSQIIKTPYAMQVQ